MEKKITILGGGVGSDNPLLTSLNDDWGGVNETQESITPYSGRGANTPVPPGKEWGMNRGEVERFVKQKLAEIEGDTGVKAGDIYWEADGTFYNLLGFATPADRALYISDPETYADKVLFSRQLPISAISSDSYICRLTGDMSASNNYVVKNGGAFEVNLRYQSVFIEGATSVSSNFAADGTIVIERSVNAGSSWTQVARISGVTSVDPTATSYPVAVNLGDYLVDSMSNRFRIRASFQYTEDGATKTKYSPYITYVVSAVNLSLNMVTDWGSPITANASTTQLQLNFTLYGAVQKYLTIKVDGTTFIDASPYDSSYNAEQTGVINITDSTKNIFTHGVHEIQAFLTCSNGNGGTLTSAVMTYHIMVINSSTGGADLTKPYLLIQELSDDVGNFVQSKICKYAVYEPNGGSINLSLIVCSSAQNYITNPSTAYLFEERVAQTGVQYELDATLEIEDQSGDTLNAYLQVLREDGGTATNFLYETTGAYYQVVSVDNAGGYAPTPGTTFYLNPKLRNNGEDNPRRILNVADSNAVVDSTWENFKLGGQDGWLTDGEGNKMLHVPAGCMLNIGFNPFEQFLTSPNSAMTMEFDMKVSNITNEDDPILRICEASGANFIGLRLRPMVGTMTTSSHVSSSTSDFSWQEDERVHISVNIHNAVSPNSAGDGLTSDGTTPTGILSLVRVFINGIINREFVYSTNRATEFCTAALSNGGIIIGQDGADISIYGIRVWTSQQLSARNVVQNYIATIPSATKKERVKKENDIIEAGVVNAEKVKALGKNVLIWHGAEIWHGAPSKQNGWWEFYQYDADGQLIPELSGTICKATKKLPSSGQGTTAKTYYYWNIQTKLTDVTDTINVLLADLHESISYTVDTENGKVAMKGGNLGSGFPLSTETTKNYDLVDIDGAQGVAVPDGWIDGNGKYRGVGYCVAPGLPLAQKLVLKINYASSMQSHIIGVNKLYNDLHHAYCGNNALQAATAGAVVAKHLEPFLFFTQASDNAAPVYRGPGAWGAGKMDKPAWGYVKNAFPNFAMIEGADNNKELTDMRVPFDDSVHGNDQYPKVYYNPEEEAWYYRTDSGLQNSQKCIDFDGGKTTDITTEQIDDTHLWAGEYPHSSIVSFMRSAWNFLFLHNPRIKPFINAGGTLGTFSDFTSSEAAQDTGNKYWCSDYKLYRYDFSDGAWVPAGLWGGNSYDEVSLRDSSAASGTLAYATYAAWNALTNNQKADYEGAVNNAFIAGIVAHAKEHIGEYFIVNSLKFHYAFQNHFIAGTDNCSKNTYYVLVPTSGSMGSWGDWKFEMHQDDVDTVLATDNSGLQTKPYYIDRMNPYEVLGYTWRNGSALVYTKQFEPKAGDFAYTNPSLVSETAVAIDSVGTSGITINSTTYAYDSILYSSKSLYQGGNNVLFNLCEAMWENTMELSDTLRSILGSMSSLSGGISNDITDSMSGVWKALNMYIFNVQRYIPAVAYNEAARIRYEFPKLMNYTSEQRGDDPIEQSMGDQLQAELQWMKRRLVYMASYAAAGEFMPATGRIGATGLSDLSDSFGMTNVSLPNSTTTTSVYTFRLVPHQWMYPTGGQATTGINPHVRVAPGAANMPNGYFEFTINPTSTTSGDDGMTIFGINYYRSIGNVGDMCFKPTNMLVLNGKRLTEFKSEPSLYYPTAGGSAITAVAWQGMEDAQKAAYLPAFRCAGISVGSATRIARLSFNGCSSVGGSAIDISGLARATSIDLRYMDIRSVSLPQTPSLASLQLPSKLTSLMVENCSALSTLSLQGYGSLANVIVTGCPQLGEDTKDIVIGMKEAGCEASLLRIHEIAWEAGVTLPVLRWMLAADTCDLTGSFVVDGTPNIDDVSKMIRLFGDIRSLENRLRVSYTASSISTVSVAGRKYIKEGMLVDRDSAKWWENLSAQIRTGNNIAVHTNADGTTVPAIKWTLLQPINGEIVIENGEITNQPYTGSYAEFPDAFNHSLRVSGTASQRRNVLVGVKVEVTTENFRSTSSGVEYTGEQTVLVASRIIGLWDRIPMVGDFAWTDGEFDNVNDESKYLAGIVVKTDDTLDENDNIIERECWIVACGGSSAAAAQAGIPASRNGEVGATGTPAWGLYPDATNGFVASDSLIDKMLNGVTEGGEVIVPGSKMWASVGKPSDIVNGDYHNAYETDQFDTPLKNYTDSLTVPVASALSDAYRDAVSDEGVASGGYKQTFANANIKNFIMNFDTKKENAILMSYADMVLKAAYRALVGREVEIPRTPLDVAEVLKDMYTCPANTYEEDGVEKHVYSLAQLRQVLFGAARACNVWSPQDIYPSTELDICEEYQRGKWMLPSSGLLTRIVCFWQNSRVAPSGTSVDPDREPYNGLSLEAFQPIFSQAVKRGRNIYFSGSSYHWCSTEYSRTNARYVHFSSGYSGIGNKYNTTVVSRPVVAFKFIP